VSGESSQETTHLLTTHLLTTHHSTWQPLREVAAVYGQKLAGDVIRIRQGQEGDGTGDVRRLGEPAAQCRLYLAATSPVAMARGLPTECHSFRAASGSNARATSCFSK
jgi:hypothetical protein